MSFTIGNSDPISLDSQTHAAVEIQLASLLTDLGATINSAYSQLNQLPVNAFPGQMGFATPLTAAQVQKLNYDVGNLIVLAMQGVNGNKMTPNMVQKIQDLANRLYNLGYLYIDNYTNMPGVNLDGSLSLSAFQWQQALGPMMYYSKYYADAIAASPSDPFAYQPFSNLFSGVQPYNLNGVFGEDSTDATWLTGALNTENIQEEILQDTLPGNSAGTVEAVLDMGGVATGVMTTETPAQSDITSFNLYYANIAQFLLGVAHNRDQQGSNYYSPTPAEVTGVLTSTGQMIRLALDGKLSQDKLDTLNALLISMEKFSNAYTNIFANQTTGWTLSPSNVLQGITDNQLTAWLSDPDLPLSNLILAGISPTPSGVVFPNGITIPVYTSSIATPALETQFNQLFQTLQNQINNIGSFGGGGGPFGGGNNFVDDANQTLSTLMDLAINGDGQGHYLTNSQLQQLGTATGNDIWGMSSGAAVVLIAGKPTIIRADGFNSDSSNIDNIINSLNAIFSNPINGQLAPSNFQLDALRDRLQTLINNLLGPGLDQNTVRKAIPILTSLSRVSSIYSQVPGEQTTGWAQDPSSGAFEFNPDPAVSTAQLQAWVQQVAANPSVLGSDLSQQISVQYPIDYNGDGFSDQYILILPFTSSNSSVTQQFITLLGQLQNIVSAVDNSSNHQVTASQLNNGTQTGLNDIVNKLMTLATGYPNNQNVPQFSLSQAKILSNLIKSINVVGAYPGSMNLTQAQNWYNSLNTSQLRSILEVTTDPVALINIAGELHAETVTSSPTSGTTAAYNTAITNIANAIKTASTSFTPGSNPILSSAGIAILNQNVGTLFNLVQSGALSYTQVSNLNILFQSLSVASSVSDDAATGENDDVYFAGSLSPGWGLGAGNVLTGISNPQWQSWFESVFAAPNSLSPLIAPTSLLASATFTLGPSSYTVYTSQAQPQALQNLFDGRLQTLQNAISQLNSNVSSFDIQNVNNAIKSLIQLATQGDGQGNYLTTGQVAQLVQTFGTIPITPAANYSFLDVAGIPTVVVLDSQGNSGNIAADINVIKSNIAAAMSNPNSTGGYAFTAVQITLISGALMDLLSQGLAIQSSGGGWFGNGNADGALSASQMASISGIFSSLSLASSSAVSPTLADGSPNPMYTTGWSTSSNSLFLNPNSTINTAQFNSWLQELIANPSLLAPAIPAENILPTFQYAISTTKETVGVFADPLMTPLFLSAVSTYQSIISAAAAAGKLNSSQIPALKQAIGGLINLAQNGDGAGHYLSIDQARAVNTLLQSLLFSLPNQTLSNTTIDPSSLFVSNGIFQGMDAYLPQWFQSILNYPAYILNPTQSLNIAGTTYNIPVSLSPIGTYEIQSEYTAIVANMRAILQNATLTSDQVTALNNYLQKLLDITRQGDQGNYFTAAQTANLSLLFTSLSNNVANWDINIDGLTASNWQSSNVQSPPSGIFAFAPIAAPTQPSTLLQAGGYSVYVPTSTTGLAAGAGANLLASLQANLKSILQQAANNGGNSFTQDQITQLNSLLGQYITLAQNGDGVSYMSSSQVSALNSLLASVSSFSSVNATDPDLQTTGWGVTNKIFTGVTTDQWNDWYHFAVQNPTSLGSLLTPDDVLNHFTYTIGGITPAVPPVSFSTYGTDQGVFMGMMGDLRDLLQQIAGRFTGPSSTSTPSLTPDDIADLNSQIGALIHLAQVGYGNGHYLSAADANNLNTLLTSLSSIVPSGWSLNAGNVLGGISAQSFTTWFQQNVFPNSSGRSLSTLFDPPSPNNAGQLDLTYATLLAKGYIPTYNLDIAGVNTPIVTPNVPPDPALETAFNTYLTSIAGLLNTLGSPSASLTTAQVATLNHDVGQLIYLAQHGAGGNLLNPSMASNLNSLLTALSAQSSVGGTPPLNTTGWTFDANHDLVGISAAQWGLWKQQLLNNPSSGAPLFQLSSVTIAGLVSAQFWTANTTGSSQNVTSSYNELIADIKILLQQTVVAGTNDFSAAQITSLNQAVGLLAALALGDGLDGNSITTTMASNINTLLASISNYSSKTVSTSSPYYTTGWTLDSTAALSTNGVNGATTTSVSTAQWQAWGDAILNDPSLLSPLYPPTFLTNQAIAENGVIPSTQINIGGVQTTVGVIATMTPSVAAQVSSLMQGIKNVVAGLASMNSPNLTPTQLATYTSILNNSVSNLIQLAKDGQLSNSALNNLKTVLSSLSNYSATTADPLGAALSPGWTTANFGNKTAVTDTQWSSWLNAIMANRNTLQPFITANDLAGPFSTLVLGGININIPFGVTVTSAIASLYNSKVNDIQAILNASKGFTSLSATQITQLQQDFGALLNLAQYGDGTGGYVSSDMAQNLSLLFSSLNAVGTQGFTLNAVSGGFSLDIALAGQTGNDPMLWQSWRDLCLSTNMLQSVFAKDVTPVNFGRSLQAMVELNYVKLGNDMLAAQLSGLQQALSTTQTVLNTLTALQNLHNQIVISTKISFSAFFNPSAGLKSAAATWRNPVTGQVYGGSSGLGYEAAYTYYASAYFGTAITPQVATPANSKYIITPSAGLQWLISAFFRPNNPIVIGRAPSTYLGKTQEYMDSVAAKQGTAGAFYTNIYYTAADAIVSFFTGGKQDGPSPPHYSISSQKYEGYYIQIPNDITIPPAIAAKYNLVKPQNVVMNQDLGDGYPTTFVPWPQARGAVGNEDTTVNNGSAGEVYSLPGYSLWITSTSYPGTDTPFTTPSSEYSDFLKAATLIKKLKDAGYTYGRDANGQAIFTPPATGNPLKAVITSTLKGVATGLDSTLKALLYDMGVLSGQVATLSGLAPSAVNDPNSLYSMTKKVYDNLRTTLVTSNGQRITAATPYAQAYSGLSNWLLDGYQTGSNQAGNIQQNITFAVTAAQSLNSQQQQKVSNYLFVFEEFEKSAAAILQQLTQIIQNIAQNIAR